MTAKPFSPASACRAAQAATLALLIGFAVSGTSLAAEIKPPSSKTKRHNDRDVTIIVIDKDDHSSRSKAGKLDPSLPDPARAPASRTIRDDELTIRIKRNRDARTGSTRKPGPKIITIDKNSGACGGGGVCVIRP